MWLRGVWGDASKGVLADRFQGSWAGPRCLHFEPTSQGVRGKLFVGNLASRRGAGTGREDPQPDTNPSQLWLAVKRSFYAELLRREAGSKKKGIRGGEP